MAIMYPVDPPPRAAESELKVRRALEGLPDDWTVLHGVQWQSVRNGHPGDGEADFVLINCEHGMLVLEVKGGGVRLDAGRWSSVDRYGESHATRDPFEQATSSKHALVSYLKQRGVTRVPAGHAVVFPDLTGFHGFGPSAPPEIVWTRSDLSNVEAAVERSVRRWGLTTPIPREFAERIRVQLAPTVTARPLLREVVADVNKELLRLTDEQVTVLRGLRRNRRAIVYGGAGTGKSVLAIEEARHLARDGFSVLLCCYNRPLADVITNSVAATPEAGAVTVRTFHGMCASAVRDAGLPGAAAERTRHWWDVELPGLLPEAAERLGMAFDAVVVDEGQDFDPSWWVAIQLILTNPDEGPMYVFADTQQAVYRTGWIPPFEQPAFELEINCRNSLPIARRVAAVYGDVCTTLGTEGPDPVFRAAEGAREVGQAIRSSLDELVGIQGLTGEQLVVLSARRDVVDVLKGQELGTHRLVAPGGSGVVVETVHRYKGLEADAVLLVFSEFVPGGDDVLAYVGMSRARAYLEIIGPRALAERFGWATS